MKNFYLNKEDAVLMIVDIQGKLTVAMEYGKDVIKNTNVLVQAAKSFEFPIIITEQYPLKPHLQLLQKKLKKN